MPQSLSPREKAECWRRGVEQFNAGEFFEAHESWERIWLPAKQPDKTFLQGITQVSAAFHHAARSNRKGAASLLRKGLRKLDEFPGMYRGVRLEALRKELRKWAEALAENRYDPKKQRPKIQWQVRKPGALRVRAGQGATRPHERKPRGRKVRG